MTKFKRQHPATRHQESKFIALAVTASVLFLVLQLVMPIAKLSLIPNFDTSCYSGSFAYIEKISTSGSCGAGQSGLVGFPFVINFSYNHYVFWVVVALIDLLLLAAILFTLWIIYSSSNSHPDKSSKS